MIVIKVMIIIELDAIKRVNLKKKISFMIVYVYYNNMYVLELNYLGSR